MSIKPDYVKDDGPIREPIVKLGKMITDRVPQKLGLKKITKDDPEYWGLAPLATDEEALLALKMGVRKPKTFKQIQELSGIETDKLTEMLDHMSYTGVLEYNWENLDGKNPNNEKRWIVPMFVPGIGEFCNMNQELLNEHPELGKFFDNMTRLPLEKITPMVPPGGAGIGMHVIPVEKSISMEDKSVPVEHISHWLDKYDGKYAASPCSCRMSRKTFDEGCADDHNDWCIAVGDMADYVVETQKGGRYIDKEEALKIIKQAEDNGYVHQITNIDGEEKIFAICNCNVNVCYALRTSQLFNTPNMSRSAYVAKVKKDNCVACGRCVEYCPAGAVKLGQKLCKKDGSEVKYPKQILPSERKWGPEMWNENYRDTNRINCYDTGTAPCKTACPAHIAVQGYIKMAAQGRYQDALALIKKNNPLPAVCGRICNRVCEDECTRGDIDSPVAIDEIKRFIAEQDMNSDTRYIPEKVVPSVKGYFDEKVAIIGAGPAGLSCAYYLAEMGYSPTIFEKDNKPGGMLTYGIPPYKLEKDLIFSEIDIIKEMGVEIKTGVEVGKDITIDQLREQGFKAFYVAIGCCGGRKLGIENEDADGVMTAVEFLHTVTQEEKYELKGDVVVIGGGNVAIDAARSSKRCADDSFSVNMFCLESKDIMPASLEEIDEAEEDGVKINPGWGPKEILVENGQVTGVVFKRCISVFDENNKFAPKFDENDCITVPCKHIILSVGQSIEWGNLLDGSNVKLGRGNVALADKITYQTDEPDIFVGGDVYTGPSFAINAIAAGKQGAVSIHRFVQPHSSLTIGRNKYQFKTFDKDDLSYSDYDTAGRQAHGMNPKISYKKSFKDATITFTEEQLKTETSRCLSCGAAIVDENKCIGCGLCTTKCEFDAIHMYRDYPECSQMRKSEDKLKYILPYAAKQAIKIKFKRNK
ncbi:MAG: FAD-dependent oxidoreductase [Eubacteriales bacterium]|nr:FAD-dependent oxidoreductase [Eubacteriales bacterium]